MNKNLSEGNMGERNFQKGKNKLRIVAILAVAVILLVQGTFFLQPAVSVRYVWYAIIL